MVEVKGQRENETKSTSHLPLPSVFALVEMKRQTIARMVVEVNHAASRLVRETRSAKAVTKNVAQRHVQR